MIKVVLWDIDGTLLNFLEAEKVAIRSCFESFSFGSCTDEMLKTYSEINKEYWRKLERNEMTKPEILVNRFVDFFKVYGLDYTKASDFNEMYQLRLGDTAVFYEGGKETVEALTGRVLQCAVTNGTKVAQERKLRNSGLDKLLDAIYISEDIGVEKPNVEFFDKVITDIYNVMASNKELSEKYGIDGSTLLEEVMIVGDSLTSDIQGGVNASMKTCYFNVNKTPYESKLRIDYEISSLNEVVDIINEENNRI